MEESPAKKGGVHKGGGHKGGGHKGGHKGDKKGKKRNKLTKNNRWNSFWSTSIDGTNQGRAHFVQAGQLITGSYSNQVGYGTLGGTLIGTSNETFESFYNQHNDGTRGIFEIHLSDTEKYFFGTYTHIISDTEAFSGTFDGIRV